MIIESFGIQSYLIKNYHIKFFDNWVVEVRIDTDLKYFNLKNLSSLICFTSDNYSRINMYFLLF